MYILLIAYSMIISITNLNATFIIESDFSDSEDEPKPKNLPEDDFLIVEKPLFPDSMQQDSAITTELISEKRVMVFNDYKQGNLYNPLGDSKFYTENAWTKGMHSNYWCIHFSTDYGKKMIELSLSKNQANPINICLTIDANLDFPKIHSILKNLYSKPTYSAVELHKNDFDLSQRHYQFCQIWHPLNILCTHLLIPEFIKNFCARAYIALQR